MDHRIIRVGKAQVGIIGLEKIFDMVKESGLEEPQKIKDKLLFLAKKDNYIPSSMEDAYKEALYKEYQRFLGVEIKEEYPIPEILVLGPGCPICDKLEQEVLAVLEELKIQANFEHIRDPETIKRYKCYGAGGLVLNGKLKCAGRVPSRADLKKWIMELVEKK